MVQEPRLEQHLKTIVKELSEVIDVHEFQFKTIRDRLYVSCHCTCPTICRSRVCTMCRQQWKFDLSRSARIVPGTDSSGADDR